MVSSSASTKFRVRSRLADSVTVAVVVATVCVPVWPGIFTVDSQAILRHARQGTISGWWAPLLGWLWGRLDRIGVGPGEVFLVGVVVFVVTVLVLAKQFLSDGAARVVTFGTVLFPPVYGLLGWVGRDVWFATAALGITAAAWHVQKHGRAASSLALIALALFGVVAADSRQNGAPFAVLAVSLAAEALSRRLWPHAGRALRAAVTVAALGIFWGVLLSAQRAVISSERHSEQYLYSRDLIAVSLELGEPMLDSFLFPSQDVEALRARLTNYGPEDAVNLVPPLVRFEPGNRKVTKAWFEQWLHLVRKQPYYYLKSRTELYGDLLGVSGTVRSPYFGASDRFRDEWRFGEFSNKFPRALEIRNRLLSWVDFTFANGFPLHTPLLYVVTSIVAVKVLGRRASAMGLARLLVLVLAAMQAILFFTAGTPEFRFQYFQVVLCVCLCSIILAGDPSMRLWWLNRRNVRFRCIRRLPPMIRYQTRPHDGAEEVAPG